MNETPEACPEPDTTKPDKANMYGRIPALSWTLFILALFAAFFAWDFSEIIFARQHREAALELVRPGMRLMQAERALNQQHYITLYISKPGIPPALDVSTCRRLPWTFELFRKLFPRWRAPERIADRLLTGTHFKIIADQDGNIQPNANGQPLIEL